MERELSLWHVLESDTNEKSHANLISQSISYDGGRHMTTLHQWTFDGRWVKREYTPRNRTLPFQCHQSRFGSKTF
jgi:hypothetical protein